MEKLIATMAFSMLGILTGCNCVFATRSVVYQLMQDSEKGGANYDNSQQGESMIQADESDSGKVDLTK